MKTPIFVCTDGDVLVFLSLKTAEGYLEAPDIEDLKAYDAEGKLLSISASGYQVKVSDIQNGPLCEEELKAAIRGFLSNLNAPVLVSSSTDLASLLELMEEYAVEKSGGTGFFIKVGSFFSFLVRGISKTR